MTDVNGGAQGTADSPLDAPKSEASQAERTTELVRSAWINQARWSKTANALKAALGRWRLIAAIGGVVGALLATLSAALPAGDSSLDGWRAGLALLGAAVLAVVAVILRTRASHERIQAWVRARAASEALKEEIYRYLVGGTPYGPDRPAALFAKRQDEQMARFAGLNLEVAAVSAPTEIDRRPLGPLTVDDYIEQRVNGQIDRYYTPKATENARMAKRLRDLEFVLLVVAAGLGAVAAGTASVEGLSALGSWVAVVTTAGAAVTAHLAAGRYDHQAIAYQGTAFRLTALRNGFLADPTAGDPTRISKFVDDVENAISSENEAWLAGWSRDEERRSAPVTA
jgi:hypothetical protein